MQMFKLLSVFNEIDLIREQVHKLDEYDPLTSIIKERFKMEVARHLTSLTQSDEEGIVRPSETISSGEKEYYQEVGLEHAITQLFFDLTNEKLDGIHVVLLYEMLFHSYEENSETKNHSIRVIDELLQWFRERQGTQQEHPLELAAIFHHKFSVANLFEDGNGRGGRLLLNAILLRHDYLPVLVLPDERTLYYETLQFADQGNIKPLVRFIANKELQTLQDFVNSPEYLSVLGKYELEMQLKQLNGSEKCIVLTEDSDTSGLLAFVLEASGFKMSETNIISYEGCSKLSSANLFSIFVKEKMPHVKIVVHRDRDYLTPDEIDDIANQFRRIDVHFFVTKGTDIESHFLNAEHVQACHPVLLTGEAVKLVKQCLYDTREKSIEMLRKKEFGGSNNAKHTHLNGAIKQLVDQNLFRFTHGKTALRTLQRLINQNIQQNAGIERYTVHLSDPHLTAIAKKIWRKP
ncbi:MAG: hypothetical protein A2W92_06725 [Bacteroidetes bacterium GWA2_42_15]|nr:MAG: hypothetical protein A2W92_06725 [Bacteroidetes bacterium GWA2_42_15]